MKRILLAALILSLPLIAQKPRVKRASLEAVEKAFDQRVATISDDPFLMLGPTRGIYLEGYGAVFTAEINLVSGPTLNPFQPTIPPAQIEQVRSRKLQRLPILRERMRDLLLASASELGDVPPQEQLVLGVRLLYRSYENTGGMPSQIIMQGERASLIKAASKAVPVESALRVQEF
jgi:hypothetical protein